jgi:hypothetical protein
MNTIEESYASLLGRRPSDEERQTLLRSRDAFNLRNNDALWMLLMVLGHYETLYSRFPSLIAKAAADVTERAKSAAEAEFKVAAARVRADLAQSVAKSARDIADRVASTKRWQWASACLVLAASIFVGVGASMYREGVSSGRAAGERDGYSKARDETAAAGWANTPEGKLAYRFAEVGSLRALATCSGKVFVQKGSACYVRFDKASVFGWMLPPAAKPER